MLKSQVKVKKLRSGPKINLPAIELNNLRTNQIEYRQPRHDLTLNNFSIKNADKQVNARAPSEESKHFSSDESNTSGAHTSDLSSPTSTVSPISETLKHSAQLTREHDLSRTLMSESFYGGFEQNTRDTDFLDSIDIRIFFPTGSAVQFNVENGTEATADDLLKLMADQLNIYDFSVAQEALAIWVVSPLLEIQLKSHHVPYQICENWHVFLWKFANNKLQVANYKEQIALDEPLLVLRRNLLLAINREIKFVNEYEGLTNALYFDARDGYLSGHYPVDIETTLELVGLQLAIEFGPYDGKPDEALDLIYDYVNELAPSTHVKAIRSFHLFGLRLMECKRGLENSVIDEYRSASTSYQNNHERRKAFLDILRKTEFYGHPSGAFYPSEKSGDSYNVQKGIINSSFHFCSLFSFLKSFHL